jgi:hypothetical protein
MTLYTVTATEKFQAAGDGPTKFEIEAKNKKEAISEARKQMGWRSRYDSPVTYRAEEWR